MSLRSSSSSTIGTASNANANASTAKKGIKPIKPYRSSAELNEDHFKGIWELLRNAINTIYRSEQSQLSFEELYRNAYTMVVQKRGESLYRGLKEVLTEHLSNDARQINAEPDTTCLSALNAAWEKHMVALGMIRDILMYMDRNYVSQQKLHNVMDLGYILFRDVVVRSIDPSTKLRERICNVLLANIYAERQGESIDRSLIRRITSMLVALAVDLTPVYEMDFERSFLSITAEFYARESMVYLTENDAATYINKAEKRLKEEDERVDHYLDHSTRLKLIRTVEKEIITAHMRKLLEMENTGLIAMLENERNSELMSFYRLLSRVEDGLKEMRAVITAYIIKLGQAINSDPEISADPVKWVQAVIELKDKFDRLLTNAFDRDKSFQTTINDAFEKFVRQNAKSSEFLALFLDINLKQSIKGMSDQEIETTLDKSVVIFRFLEEKDVFERYYKQHLAKRLLFHRSVSDDVERNMIAKLKTECGYQFTSKLEGMFTDMRLSDDLMLGFREYLSANDLQKAMNGIDLSVTVLTNTFWPVTANTFTCRLPQSVMSTTDVFSKYYLGRHSGRRLTWQTNMGVVDVRANYAKRKHEFTVTVPMMAILLQFNDRDRVSYQDMLSELDMPDVELKRNLQALIFGKHKILLKESKSREIESTDEIIYNDKFSANLVRLKIQQLTSKADTDSERSETRDRIEEDRKHQIDAAVVRIMKSRKSLEHNNLVSEVIKQLMSQFAANPASIKKRVESLIEREFLERSTVDIRVYNYLA